jgi:hypothetical protein
LSGGYGKISPVKPCTRFRADGSACTNETENADRWCREPDCPGFLRSDPTVAPVSEGAPRGTARHISETGDLPTGDVTVEDVATVHIKKCAIESFRLHHGGSEREAEVQLRSMLEDFLLKSARGVSGGGFLTLAREGYELILSPDRDTITGYSTNHRERTWEQVKAGVKSRYTRGGRARDASGPAPERGPAVELHDFEIEFRPTDVHLTGTVRGSYAKIAGLGTVSDEELDASIRALWAEFEPGSVVERDDGCFEVKLAGLIWLVSPDCRSLVGVKSTKASTEPTDQHKASEFSGAPAWDK